jgi:hypothetical protein
VALHLSEQSDPIYAAIAAHEKAWQEFGANSARLADDESLRRLRLSIKANNIFQIRHIQKRPINVKNAALAPD